MRDPTVNGEAQAETESVVPFTQTYIGSGANSGDSARSNGSTKCTQRSKTAFCERRGDIVANYDAKIFSGGIMPMAKVI
jgi:hypothetical protein